MRSSGLRAMCRRCGSYLIRCHECGTVFCPECQLRATGEGCCRCPVCGDAAYNGDYVYIH